MSPENLGTQRLPLTGVVVSESIQEEFGLLDLGNCSASLLRNDWAITAAHCVESTDAFGNPVSDPNRPGQNLLNPLGSISVIANFGGGQLKSVVRIETFRPYDVALLQLDTPVRVHGSTRYSGRILFDDQFPYWGTPVSVVLTMFGRGINEFARFDANGAPVQAQGDGLYRVGYAKTSREDGTLVWYDSNETGNHIVGGDSGGPSYAWTLDGYALVGVHAKAKVECLDGYSCGGFPNPWQWVTNTPEAADTLVKPLIAQLRAVMGPGPRPDPEPATEPPAPGYIGVFDTAVPHDPMWIYGVQPDGILVWTRQETGKSYFPRPVGSSWGDFVDIIPAGANAIYARTRDGKLMWYRHDGYLAGEFQWSGPTEVGHSWNFTRIFAGNDGIVYAIGSDGRLHWYRHEGFMDGTPTWAATQVVGTGWNHFVHVFSTGQGRIYAVQPDGKLLFYQHRGYLDGSNAWAPTRTVGSDWSKFRQVSGISDGVIIALTDDGRLLRYKHNGQVLAPRAPDRAQANIMREDWEGPVELAAGWRIFPRMVVLMPATPPPIR